VLTYLAFDRVMPVFSTIETSYWKKEKKLKGVVQPEMKIMSLYTHLYVVSKQNGVITY